MCECFAYAAVDPSCSKKNGGCHKARKCMSAKSGVQCGDCADGWINDGPKGCKKAGNRVYLHFVVRVGAPTHTPSLSLTFARGIFFNARGLC